MEKLIYPTQVFSYNHLDNDGHALPGHGEVGRMVPYDCYLDTMANREVGDILVHHASGPGVGVCKIRITRMDETGVYGIEEFNSIRELTAAEVR